MPQLDASQISPLLLHVFPSFAVGGAQMRFTTIANGLAGRYRHHVWALDGNFACATRLDPSLAIDPQALTLKKGGLGFENLPRLRTLLRNAKPDLLLTYNWGSIEFVLANRFAPLAPHVHFEDGFGPEETLDGQLPRRVWTRRLALSGRHTQLVAPSRGLEGSALRDWRVAANRVSYVPNGVDTARFVRPASHPPHQSDEPRIVWLGGLRPEKNLSFLLRALHEVKGVGLTLVGEGPEREALRAEATRLGVDERVTFAGARPDPEKALWDADIFALPSLTEQMPLSLIEAMAAGLPVLATDVGDVAEMVSPPNRPFITPAHDLSGFRTALERLLADKALRLTLGRANQEKAIAEFDQAGMIDRYDRLFQHQSRRSRAAPGAGR